MRCARHDDDAEFEIERERSKVERLDSRWKIELVPGSCVAWKIGFPPLASSSDTSSSSSNSRQHMGPSPHAAALGPQQSAAAFFHTVADSRLTASSSVLMWC
jgi:hypothetical protein